jgi:hypothetical protein
MLSSNVKFIRYIKNNYNYGSYYLKLPGPPASEISQFSGRWYIQRLELLFQLRLEQDGF